MLRVIPGATLMMSMLHLVYQLPTCEPSMTNTTDSGFSVHCNTFIYQLLSVIVV